MPRCRNCNRPIIFVRPEPDRYYPNPKAIPIDIDPDADGTVAIYRKPIPFPAGPEQAFARRLRSYALDSFVRLGGVVYRVHFDTCRGPEADAGPQRPGRRY